MKSFTQSVKELVFDEIGHSIESVTTGGGGTHILGRVVVHFN